MPKKKNSKKAKGIEDNSNAAELPEKTVEELAAEHLNGWKRALADYENLKKDVDRQRAEYAKFATQGLIEELLQTNDFMEAAILHEPDLSSCDPSAQSSVKNWIVGVKQVHKQLQSLLSGHGVKEIDVGSEFDAGIHEAAEEREDASPSGTILSVTQKGWKLHDKLIRPARVIVSSGPKEE
jgi:molecular chaperone GrpE